MHNPQRTYNFFVLWRFAYTYGMRSDVSSGHCLRLKATAYTTFRPCHVSSKVVTSDITWYGCVNSQMIRLYSTPREISKWSRCTAPRGRFSNDLGVWKRKSTNFPAKRCDNHPRHPPPPPPGQHHAVVIIGFVNIDERGISILFLQTVRDFNFKIGNICTPHFVPRTKI